jgi:ATP-dependent Lon protease
MVKTRLQKDRENKQKQEQKNNDNKNTKRSKGGKNDGSDNEDDNQVGEIEFREILATLFPSDFANRKVKEAKRKHKRNLINSKNGKKSKINKTADNSDASSSASYKSGDNSDLDSDSDYQPTDNETPQSQSQSQTPKIWKVVNGKVNKVNENKKKVTPQICIITSGKQLKSDDEDYDYDDDDEDYNPEEDSMYEEDDDYDYDEDEDEDAEYDETDNTNSEVSDEQETEQETESDNSKTPSSEEGDNATTVKNKNGKNDGIPKLEIKDIEDNFQNKIAPVPKEFQKKCRNIWAEFKDKLDKERKTFIVKNQKKQKKARQENLVSFRKMLKEGDVMNDLRYFNRIMTVNEQKDALEEMKLIKQFSHVDKPYRLRLLEAPIPPQIKAIALKKINALRYTSPGDGEYNKLKKWVDAFLQIPFGKHSELDLKLSDGKEKCHEFMENAKQVLDDAVYGLDNVKLQVMQMLGQWISNPKAVGSAMAIHGPMGTGKTTLVKEGISKILGREFIFIALGGATDSSFLEGHSYTYEGSSWGKIVDLLMQCRTMNPIIYFDELDKVSDTPRGEEIIGILTHLTDTSQNDKFHDKYFSEVDFDLSRCMFFFSYNDPEKVNPILRDRMYTIKTNGYSSTEKVTIAQKHLVPKLLPQIGFTEEEISFPKETLEYIAKEYTKDDEKGVRSLKRRLEIIFTKLNLYRLLKPGTTMFGQKIPETVQFPVTVTPELVKELLSKEEKEINKNWTMYT